MVGGGNGRRRGRRRPGWWRAAADLMIRGSRAWGRRWPLAALEEWGGDREARRRPRGPDQRPGGDVEVEAPRRHFGDVEVQRVAAGI